MKQANQNKQTQHLQQANAESRYEVTTQDLPVCCPLPRMAVWNSHPRVYLPIEETGQASCPYCGAHFILTDFTQQ